MSVSQLDMFLSEIGKLRADYQGIDARIVAFDWNGTWVNLASRFVLSPNLRKRPYRHQRSLSRIGELCLISDTIPVEKLIEITDIFANGHLSLQDKTIQFRRWGNQKWDSPYVPVFSCLNNSGRGNWDRWNVFAYSLRADESGGSMRELLQNDGIRRLESKLSSLPAPFTGIADLSTDFVGQPWVHDILSWNRLEIVAPIQVNFVSSAKLENNRAMILYDVAPGYQISKVSMGYVTSQADRTLTRGRIANRAKVKSGQTDTYQSSVRIPSSTEGLTLILSYRGQEVDRQTTNRTVISGENARITSYAKSDPDLELFHRAIEPQEKKDLSHFEDAVRVLFTFLGFSCMKPMTSDSVDIIAFTDDPQQVLLAECTTGAPDLHDKVGKLANRRNAYRKTTSPVAMIATSLPIDEISAVDQDRARKDGIVVVSRENLIELFTMANQGTTPRNVLGYLSQLLGSPF